MAQEPSLSFQLLERRLALMRDLASSLEQAEAAVVRSDVASVDRHRVWQQQLCAALGALDAEARRFRLCAVTENVPAVQKNWMPSPGSGVPPHIRQRWNALALELTKAEAQVRHLNRVYGALLRRARRTVEIFCRVLASSAVTYVPPKARSEAGSSGLEK